MLRLFTVIVFILSSWILPASAAPDSERWSFWDTADENSEEVVDHALWQQFLDGYVHISGDGINRVAYKDAAKGNGQEQLTAYLSQLTAMDPRTLNKAEQLSYWINLYNALTVEVVLRNPSKGSILRMGKGFFSIGPWDDKLIAIAGEDVTLNDIEHRILRPIWQDHRIHFAVNCASIGCPNLSKTAFRADNTEALLAEGEEDYLNHERGLQLTKRGKLQASQIFEWYQTDFADNKEELIEYFAARHDTLGSALEKYKGKIKYEYDWGLNSKVER